MIVNGRVNPYGPQNVNYVDNMNSNNNCSYQSEAVSHQIGRTPLSDLFFSKENIDMLQNGMRNMVLNRTQGQHIIQRQSDMELKIIMRAMYLQHARHKEHVPIVEQVRELNIHVLNFSVPRIISSINMKQQYLKDISQLPVPLEHARKMKDTKQLELKSF